MKNRKKARAAATAEQPARLVVELAGFRRRVASLVYESLLLMGVLALTFLVPYLTIGVLWERALPGWVLWVVKPRCRTSPCSFASRIACRGVTSPRQATSK